MSLGSGGVCVGAGGVHPRGAIAGLGSASGAVVSVAVLEASWSSPGGSPVWQAVRRRRAAMQVGVYVEILMCCDALSSVIDDVETKINSMLP